MQPLPLIHTLSGILVGLTGLAQILLKKGGKRHRIIGTIYFYAWIVVVVTGGIMGSFLITLFGVLGLYMAYTGYRFGHYRKAELEPYDKVVIGAGLLMAVVTLIWGLIILIQGNTFFGIVATFFGLIFAAVTVQDLREYILGQKVQKISGHKAQWIFEHLTRMYVSYIAALTPFAVIQEVFPVAILNWILPTFIGTALIIWSNRFYRKKYKVNLD